jgi:hypothetical protein
MQHYSPYPKLEEEESAEDTENDADEDNNNEVNIPKQGKDL